MLDFTCGCKRKLRRACFTTVMKVEAAFQVEYYKEFLLTKCGEVVESLSLEVFKEGLAVGLRDVV